MKPLSGHRVVVTRAASQAAEYAEAFRRAGADVRLLPLLEILPPRDESELRRAALAAVEDPFDWWVFTSANAVRAFLPLVPSDFSAKVRCAAVGPATEAALEEAGFSVARRPVASQSRAEGLARVLAPDVTGRRVLVPLADDARPTLVTALREAGAEVHSVVAYRKVLPSVAEEAADDLFGGPPWGWVTVTSPRLARHLRQVLEERWEVGRSTLKAASIGPVTSSALRNLGIDPAAQATEPSAEGLVSAVVDTVGNSPF